MPNRSRKEPTQNAPAKKQVAASSPARVRTGAKSSVAVSKFNAMQLAELLKPFWMDLLQNNLKNVKKFLQENRSKLDFNTLRYTPCADGTGLHLCAQHGFIDCAKMLLDHGVKIDLQNKVGSTALHVACKFNQEEMVLFLLETGARMDIPDLRNNVAFDVAPYMLLDKCLLSPQRMQLDTDQQEEARLLEIHQAAMVNFDEVTLAKAHASMLLVDWESCAWEEWQSLQATNKLDREWNEQVQRSKKTLEIKRAMYTDLQVLMKKEQDQIAQMWKNIFQDARDRKQRAREELEQNLMLAEETHQHWMREQQELWDQCGLIETAQEFPNDADVQQWVLSTMIAMIDEAESGCAPVNPRQDLVTTDINELLLCDEIISVLRNVLLRFPTTRHLQFSGVQCFMRLVRHCMKTPLDICSFKFLTALIKANVMALSRDVLSRFSQDMELAHLVIDLLYHLLQFRGENGAHSLQFCQNRSSHQLPLQVLRLHEATQHMQSDTKSPNDIIAIVTPEEMLTVRYHTSYLLFTLTKYNVRKVLDENGALPLVRRLIFQLTKDSHSPIIDHSTDEVTTLTLRYLLGTLALLHSPQSTRENSRKASPRPELPTSWSVNDLSELLGAIRPWLSVVTSTTCGSWHRSLAFWTVKLLRNLTQVTTDEVVQFRMWLRTRQTFELFAEITLAIQQHKMDEGDDGAVQDIAAIWLELVEDIWLCRYNSDGQLAATPEYVMEFLLDLLELEAQLTRLLKCRTAIINFAAVLKLVALVLSNGKNMHYLADHEYKIDGAVNTVLKTLLDIKQGSQDTDANIEVLAHILRVYLRFFDFKRDHSKTGVSLHERCRAIGICAALQAFGLADTENRSAGSINASLITSANQVGENSTESTSDSKLKSKMQIARALSRSTSTQQPIHGPERENLRALARALLRHAPCNC